MDKIASKLQYLKGILKGMELNGAEKNIIIEEIIDILELFYENIFEIDTIESSYKDLNINIKDSFSFEKKSNLKKMHNKESKNAEKSSYVLNASNEINDRSDFDSKLTKIINQKIKNDESLQSNSMINKVLQDENDKTFLEKICKHCGTYIKAEFSSYEYNKVKIQCPKCKHFILPDDGFIYGTYPKDYKVSEKKDINFVELEENINSADLDTFESLKNNFININYGDSV